jgi:hypothetical protein
MTTFYTLFSALYDALTLGSDTRPIAARAVGSSCKQLLKREATSDTVVACGWFLRGASLSKGSVSLDSNPRHADLTLHSSKTTDNETTRERSSTENVSSA